MALPPSPSTALETLAEKVGGFYGYAQSSGRMLSDRHLRNFLVTGIEKIISGLDAIPAAEQIDNQRLLAEALHSTRRKLLTICESLKDPTYSGRDFFTRELLSEKRLARIYLHEMDMLEELEEIHSEVAGLQNNTIEKETIDDHFLHISDSIDNLNQALFERECLILGDQ